MYETFSVAKPCENADVGSRGADYQRGEPSMNYLCSLLVIMFSVSVLLLVISVMDRSEWSCRHVRSPFSALRQFLFNLRAG